jgi:uncharacterized protein (TIRG00374 family)
MAVSVLDRASGARSLKRAAAVLVGAVAVGGIAASLGVGAVWEAVARVDASVLAAVVGTAVVILVLRGVALWTFLDILGYRTPPVRVLSVYAATVAVSAVVPGGQAGGAPVNGYLVSQAAEADYEDGITAVVCVAVLSNAAVALFGLLGVGYIVATTTGRGGVLALAVLGTVLFGLVAIALAGVWRVRDRAVGVLTAAIASAGRVAVVIPGVSPPERDAIDAEVNRFGDAIDRLRGATPRQFALLVGTMGAAHALTVLALWVSFVAVGEPISVGVILAVIPAGVATAIVPTPGGFGSIEVALVGLLAAGTSASVQVTSAAVLVYQTATTGFMLLVGGGVLAVMLTAGLVDSGRLRST